MAEIKIQRGLPIQQKEINPEKQMREAAKMYEQYFLNEMVRSMRKTVQQSDLIEQTMGEKIYSEQLDNQYVESWADRGGVGLANIIYDQLQERFFNHQKMPPPQGPVQIEKGTTIKIDESNSSGIPVITPKSSLPSNEVSFLYQWSEDNKPKERTVQNPFSGTVTQTYRVGEDRNILKLAHDDGLISTLSYIGSAENLATGDYVEAGRKLGSLSPYALGLTWHVAQAGS